MIFSPLVEQLIRSLTCLPGVGTKSAQRMALHLLERDHAGANRLAEALNDAVELVDHCKQCRIFSEMPYCSVCSNDARDRTLMCVVETPADALAIELSGTFNGLYFVLMGHLSPIDGIGPEELGMDLLKHHLQGDVLQEVILATGTTVEGEATAHFISEMVNASGKNVSRIAHGVPMGGELEYVDSNTLNLAFNGRRLLD
jgi:recombination protein RecR